MNTKFKEGDKVKQGKYKGVILSAKYAPMYLVDFPTLPKHCPRALRIYGRDLLPRP